MSQDVQVDPGSFDSVIATHVLCSVGDAASAVLNNVDSALRVGGTFVSMEHVSAPAGSALSAVQALIAPAFTIIANGCQFRNAESLIRAHLPEDRYDISVKYFDAPMPLAAFVPHVHIRATKKSNKGRK